MASKIKQILLPISFSEASANSIRQAHALFEQSQLTLMHCYSPQPFNRAYDFGGQSYEEGIRDMLLAFYNKNVDTPAARVRPMARPGSVSETLLQVSGQYDLMVISKQVREEFKGYWLSEKTYFISASAHCPVLLLPFMAQAFDFSACKTIWHIDRKKNEQALLQQHLPELEVDLQAVQTKSLGKTTLSSSLWKAIFPFARRRDKKFMKEMASIHENEKIDLVILVSHGKDTFQQFMRDDVMQRINQLGIPVLVLHET